MQKSKIDNGKIKKNSSNSSSREKVMSFGGEEYKNREQAEEFETFRI
jgi:hypothetical protein